MECTSRYASAESTHKNDVYSALEDYLLENCTIDMPADYRSDVIEAIRANFIDRYCSGDESQMETVLSSYGYTEESIEFFLKEQGRLYDEPVAETVEEAEEFLSAIRCPNCKHSRF